MILRARVFAPSLRLAGLGRLARASAAIVVALLCLLSASGPGLAADITCTAANLTLDYGSYDVLAGSVLDVGGSITVTCVATGGAHGAVTYTAALTPLHSRELAPPSGADRLSHNIYVDSARTQPWGNGTGGTFTLTGSVTVPQNGSITDAAKNIYGRISPGGQDVSAASPGPPPTTHGQVLTVTVTSTSGRPSPVSP